MGKRAAQGAGSIRKKEVNRNGKRYVFWEARITTGRDPGTGKQIQRSISGKTQKEVREKLQAMAVELNEGTYQDPSRMKVSQWLHIWLSEYTGDVKTLTQSSYESQVNTNIIPHIGAVRLQDLNAVHIQHMYNGFLRREKPLSSKTIKNIHGIMHKALEQAVELKFIKFNPSDACKLPRVEKKEINPLDDQEITVFLTAIQGHKYEKLFLVDLFTGMRQGELLGLKWEDVNFKTGTIHVRRQLIREKKKGGCYLLATLKNDKTRRISPAPTVMKCLRELQREQSAQRIRMGPLWEDSGLVFTNELGGHLAHVTVYKAFKKVVRGIGLSDTRFHDLRHSFAVISLESGDDIKTLQDNLGHHSAAFTMDTYGHVTDRMKKESSERMERFINGIKVI